MKGSREMREIANSPVSPPTSTSVPHRGSSFVPAVRALFLGRFGAVAIETGGEFESIATGLALIAPEPEPGGWRIDAV